MKKKTDRRETYAKKMERLGFRKLQPWVHEDDAETILSLAKKLREKRLRAID